MEKYGLSVHADLETRRGSVRIYSEASPLYQLMIPRRRSHRATCPEAFSIFISSARHNSGGTRIRIAIPTRTTTTICEIMTETSIRFCDLRGEPQRDHTPSRWTCAERRCPTRARHRCRWPDYMPPKLLSFR